jgi:hypothetical protein
MGISGPWQGEPVPVQPFGPSNIDDWNTQYGELKGVADPKAFVIFEYTSVRRDCDVYFDSLIRMKNVTDIPAASEILAPI